MKALISLVAVAAVALSSPAWAQSAAEKTGVNSVLGVSPTTADFVKEAAMSDLLEIQTSKLAQKRSRGDIKTFADEMVQDHTKTSNELKSLISSGKLKATAPTHLDSKAQDKLKGLQQAADEDFASDYVDMQVSAHKDAVSLFERYAKGGENAGLKAWAGKTLPTLKHHLEMAQELDKKH